MDATAYILADSPEAEVAVADNAARQIESGASKLLNIVLSLRPFIDGDNLIQEAKAIEYLSTVLALLDPSTLVRQDVSLMCRYFEARIEVGHNAGLKESAVGLRVLASMKHFDSKEAKEIAEKIFSIIDSFNEYPVSLRIEIYKLLHLLMEQYRHVLKLDSETFIPGLLALADLEKDPRNLMLYFSMLLVVLAEWDTDSHKERLWEAVSKYFPITFRPRPNDPIGITADDLKSRLRSCIAATSAFAPWSFSFLIEKLDHQVTANVKKDVMQTMAACVENYSPKAVSTWASQVWDALKYEVLSATDDELAGEALKVLKAIATRLSVPGVTLERPENAGVLRYTEMICKESIKHLQDRKQLKATGQILGRVAAGSPSSFESIVQNIFPRLITIVQDTDSFLQRKDLLEVFNEVLDALFELMQEQGIRHGADPIGYGGLVLFVDSLFQIYSMNLTGVPVAESALRTSAVRGFLNVARLPSFLQPNEVGMIIQNLNDVIMETGNAALRDAALSSLQEIAGEYPQQIGDITFPKLLAALPAVLQPHVDVVTVAPHLQALAFISMGSHLFAIFVRRLSNKLEDIFRASQDSESANSYGCAILGSIFYCIQERELKHEAKTKEGEQEMKTVRSRDLEQYQSLLKYLCTFCFSKTSFVDGSGQQRYYVGLKTYGSDNHKSTSETFIHRAGRICTLLVRSLDINDQQQTVSEIFTLFVDVPRPQAAGAVLENVVQAHSQLANKPVGDAATVLLSLIMSYSILAGLRKETTLDFDPVTICRQILHYFDKVQDLPKAAYGPLSILMALLINKWNVEVTSKSAEGESIKDIIARQMVFTVPDGSEQRSEDAVNGVIQGAVCVTNAVNLKGGAAVKPLLELLVDALSSPNGGAALAKRFKFPFLPPDIFCKENAVVMRGLYKQRPFAICFPKLLDQYKSCTDQNVKSNYLVALSGILENTPSEVILPEIEQLMPVLLQAMDSPNQAVKAASIKVLSAAIGQSSSSIEGHIRSVILRLLTIAQQPSKRGADITLKVRLMALKCLADVPLHLKKVLIEPYVAQVLRELERPLSDGRRDVREGAVKCRYTWFKLITLTEEED